MASANPDIKEQTRKIRLQEVQQDIQSTLERITHCIMVMSGKGGVGKSSVAAALAVSLARAGKRVGLMDVDLHGPSIPGLLGLHGHVTEGAEGKLMKPLQHESGLKVMSIGFLLEKKNSPVVWRGPLKGAAIRQFIADGDWGELDYLIIDSPPGTGDEPMTVVQSVPEAKALIVTTPQEVALADVRKSISFCYSVKMDILGIVQNMSGLRCPHCGTMISLFGSDGGVQMALQHGLPLLANLPLDPEVVAKGDNGEIGNFKDCSPEYRDAMAALVRVVATRLPTEQCRVA